MKIKTYELAGTALDWAVAKCKGLDIEFEDPCDPWLTLDGIAHQPLHSYTPSIDWAQGGPIIEREGINLDNYGKNPRWSAWTPAPDRESGEAQAYGPTPLIAAMRCFVVSKLGYEVDAPDELIKE